MASGGRDRRRPRSRREGLVARALRTGAGSTCSTPTPASPAAACRCFEQPRRAVAGGAARQPDRPVPGHQARRARHGAAGRGSIICTASVAGLRANAGAPPYAREQGGRHQPGADGGQRALRHRRARQRHLPRPDRDRHDQADLRRRPRARHRGQDRPAQSAAPLRRAGRNRGRWRCSWPATTPPTSTARPCGRRRPEQHAPVHASKARLEAGAPQIRS